MVGEVLLGLLVQLLICADPLFYGVCTGARSAGRAMGETAASLVVVLRMPLSSSNFTGRSSPSTGEQTPPNSYSQCEVSPSPLLDYCYLLVIRM